MLPGTPRARHPRLQARRHLEPLRRAGHHHRQGHRRAAQPPPRDRVQEVPADASTARSPPSSTSTSCSTTPRTHKTPAIQRWLAAHPRFVLHFTPTSSSLAEPRRALVRRADDQEARAAARTAPSASSTPTSAPGSRPGTTTPSPSSGPRPPTRSSTRSPATAPNQRITTLAALLAASRRRRARPCSGAPCPRASAGSRRSRRSPTAPARAWRAARRRGTGTCSIGGRAGAAPAPASRPASISRALCASTRVPYCAHSGDALARAVDVGGGRHARRGRDAAACARRASGRPSPTAASRPPRRSRPT